MKRPQGDRISEVAIEEVAHAEVAPDGGVALGAWLDMKTAPLDGSLIEYDQDKYARLRTTRRRMDGRWTPVSFWVDAFTAQEVAPQRYRLPAGFSAPGMVRC